MASETRWVPLESNPEVMTKYLHKMGMSKGWQFVDVYGMDPDLLAMVPQPVSAVMLLFPISEGIKATEDEQQKRIEADGQTVNPDVYFMRQFVGNACGTIGVLHAVLNNQKDIPFESASTLEAFLQATKDMNAEDRGHHLETDKGISDAHKESAQEGQTEAPSADDKIQPHFIALVHNNGHLYELDGRKPFPINHGATSPDTLLQDAAKVCQEFMKLDPKELRFTVMALSKVD